MKKTGEPVSEKKTAVSAAEIKKRRKQFLIMLLSFILTFNCMYFTCMAADFFLGNSYNYNNESEKIENRINILKSEKPIIYPGEKLTWVAPGQGDFKMNVVYRDNNGGVLNSFEENLSSTHSGATVSYTVLGMDVVKPEYASTFVCWKLVDATSEGSAVKSVTMDAVMGNYTITWKNYDGTVLGTTQVGPGTVPAWGGANPSRGASAQYTYSFSGWRSSGGLAPYAADKNETYTAQYTPVLRNYKVTWKNWDGTDLEVDAAVPYGTTPVYDGETPTKPETEEYSYTFTGWDPEVASVTGDATYTAQFTQTRIKYPITWKNYDGTVLMTDEVEYGTVPSYTGDAPTKPSDADYHYSFSGWDPAPVAVTGAASYTATFDAVPRPLYTITWKNYDGTVLETDKEVKEGTMPSYDGATPTRKTEKGIKYTFDKWDPEIQEVTGDATYTAVYSEEELSYTVTWVNYDGTVLEKDKDMKYGDMPKYNGGAPEKPADEKFKYTFSGWSPAVSKVKSSVTYMACFNEEPNLEWDGGDPKDDVAPSSENNSAAVNPSKASAPAPAPSAAPRAPKTDDGRDEMGLALLLLAAGAALLIGGERRRRHG